MKRRASKDRRNSDRPDKNAAAQHLERQEVELEEDRARRTNELVAQIELQDLQLQFFDIMVNPTSRLMVRRTAYEELRGILQQQSEVSASQQLAVQREMYDLRKNAALLQRELMQSRTETKLLSVKISNDFEALKGECRAALAELVSRLEQSIFAHREQTMGFVSHLNLSLENARLQQISLIREISESVAKPTAALIESTSMHTRIPKRIRSKLQCLEREDLLLMLDTLSFEDVVLDYLMMRYPPGADDPFASGV